VSAACRPQIGTTIFICSVPFQPESISVTIACPAAWWRCPICCSLLKHPGLCTVCSTHLEPLTSLNDACLVVGDGPPSVRLIDDEAAFEHWIQVRCPTCRGLVIGPAQHCVQRCYWCQTIVIVEEPPPEYALCFAERPMRNPPVRAVSSGPTCPDCGFDNQLSTQVCQQCGATPPKP
jgi:hypothetical protein